MINERARSLARKPKKKKVELQGTTASWSSVGVISCTRLLCIVVYCFVLSWMKELTSGVVDDDYDDDHQGSAMIFATAAMRSTCCCCMCGDNLRVRSLCKRLAHIATANFLPARHRREGKGREVGKGSREGKRRAGFSGLSSVDSLVRRFTRCPRQTTPVLSPDACSSIHISSSSSSIPAHPSTVSRDQSFFFHLFHIENLAEFNPQK